ncbi:MAG: hypothetical protein UW34_C0017G0003 [Parcubacteria group bacterium GW2011_GWA2_44_15]|nr:MAG: hypothetical protein UW34_C0017G0003 [Parcubacteria group bacterium GW2011_GWA2_44_15]
MENDELFTKVRDLKLSSSKYILFGSAPMGIRGPKVCHDIDIVVTEDLWNGYKNKGWKIKMMPHGSQYLSKEDIELWADWIPGEWNIQKLIAEAEMIKGLPFVKLAEVVKWEKILGRKKDLEDIVYNRKIFTNEII